MVSKSLKWLFFALVAYASYLLVLLSLPYLAMKPDIDFLLTKQFVYHIDIWRWSFYVHVFSSAFVIISGLLQFNRWTIRSYPKIHKVSGYVYVSCLLLISGPGALIMSLYANGGFWPQLSFTLLSVLWIGFTLYALILVYKKRYVDHGNWLLRSYALTLSAVTLRFYLMIFDFLDVPLGPIESYTIVAYASWIPNLIFAEILIRRGFVEKLFKE
ncbi:MAG: DUF2306 domain-containing protein [Bacteroidota bacterium]